MLRRIQFIQGAWLLVLLASCDMTNLFDASGIANRGVPRVSEDGRRLVDANGKPFFWLGDTAWELFHRLDRSEVDLYLEDRAARGFNVIQAVILAEFDGLHTPNAYGETPLIGDDPERPNEAYFKHVDYVVDKAEDLGLYIGLLPTWGDKFNKKWGVGPEVFTPENARVFGHFLGQRYANKPVIWILGGDRNPDDADDLAIIRAMAEGIRTGDGGRHLITYHPEGGRGSWQWFEDDGWLALNFFQSGHGAADIPNDRLTDRAYGLRPARPVIDGEPRYEDHPIGWDPRRGWFDAFDVRQAAYWSVLAGAAGHTYGNHNVWQFWEPGRESISSARTDWHEALSQDGASQVGFMKALFLSRPFLTMRPGTHAVRSKTAGAFHIMASVDSQGRCIIAYSPYGLAIDTDVSSIDGEAVTAWWFDPRTGQASQIGTFERRRRMTFDPPGEPARGNDWVLVIDDASAGFTSPGVSR